MRKDTMQTKDTSKKIAYVKGDATAPIGDGRKIIAHICNDCVPGKWGAGFVLALSRRWKQPEMEYRRWSVSNDPKEPFVLGTVQFIQVTPDIVVANMVAQHGVGSGGTPPIRYEALERCLNKVAGYAVEHEASVHGPKFGSGLAGGNWGAIEKIISDTIIANNINVTIYEF